MWIVKAVFFAAIPLFILAGYACAGEASIKLAVVMEGFRNNGGSVMAALFQRKDGFPEEYRKALKVAKSAIMEGTAKIGFDGLVPGEYAVSVFHDENGDGELDKNMLGMPKEGYGASNNELPAMSAPEFEKALFVVKQGEQTIRIGLRY